MYTLKTKEENQEVLDYLKSLEPARRREDAFKLLQMFEEETPWPAVLWTGGMVGFGKYDYTYDSGHSGTAFRVGFAPRKGKISLYTWLLDPKREQVLSRLGKHTTGVACVYVNKLADVDESVLRELIREAVALMEVHYPEAAQG